MDDDRLGTAPNYTTACIVMFGVNLAWVLVVIWAHWGLVAAVFLGACVNVFLKRLAIWRARVQAASIRRGKTF